MDNIWHNELEDIIILIILEFVQVSKNVSNRISANIIHSNF